ncbi:MAG: hypothetical protein RBT64_11285 [Trichloromonas sp.]|jgi:hypothetical protein|nr:hypothetical protein [Trichloromonas sp.]
MSIQPIETRYRGYRFRSRLEAKWAVFFDAAKIRWLYEPQGFVVDGRPYLPDFYLPDIGCYFEVKPTSEYDLDFLQSFAYEVGENVVVAEGGIPDPAEWACEPRIQLRVLYSVKPEECPDGFVDGMAWGYNDMFLQCDNCGCICIMNEVYSTMKNNCGACGDSHARWMPLSFALETARGARFEHGERG